MLDWEDVALIREMVATLGPDPVRIIDLGAGSGTTAGAIYAERPDAYVWTIDIVQESVDWAGLFLSRIIGVGGQWHGWAEDSVKAALSFEDGSLDMVLIDTTHEYEGTVKELEAWLPKLKNGGLLWCHDYRGVYPGVTRAVDEFEVAGLIEMIDIRGLGWGGHKP